MAGACKFSTYDGYQRGMSVCREGIPKPHDFLGDAVQSSCPTQVASASGKAASTLALEAVLRRDSFTFLRLE